MLGPPTGRAAGALPVRAIGTGGVALPSIQGTGAVGPSDCRPMPFVPMPGLPMHDRPFSVWVAGLTAAACLVAALPTVAVLGDVAGGIGLAFGTIWMGCLAWLLDVPNRPDETDADATSRTGRFSFPAKEQDPTGPTRSRIVAAVMTAAIVAQLVAFHYSTRVDF